MNDYKDDDGDGDDDDDDDDGAAAHLKMFQESERQ